MINIGFWYDRPIEYTGGLNYYYNLLYAIRENHNPKINPIIFFGKKTNLEIIKKFSKVATVIQTSVLDKMSVMWILHNILYRFFGSILVIEKIAFNKNINVISHASTVIPKKNTKLKFVYWMPDFQCFHLPELFPGVDLSNEASRIKFISRKVDAIIFSSKSAYNDYLAIIKKTPACKKTAVINFVSQVKKLKNIGGVLIEELESKFNFKGPYFYLPNQFWSHKNHYVVFEAVKKLREDGVDVLLICSGNLIDYRLKNNQYIDHLMRYIKVNDLENHIKILGLIDYDEVQLLMAKTLAVINPSKFEGWSSSVEEAKSFGKIIILSSIPVHVEQAPSNAIYFDHNDSAALKKILQDVWSAKADGDADGDAVAAEADIFKRTIDFGDKYIKLINSLMKKECM